MKIKKPPVSVGWTPAMDAELMQRHRAGESFTSLGKVFGCSRSATACRYYKITGENPPKLVASHRAPAAESGDNEWTKHLPDIQRMVDAGMSSTAIASHYGVEPGRICRVLDQYRIVAGVHDRVSWKERLCLGCRIMFRSAGPQNRMCDRCKSGVDYTSPESRVAGLRVFF